MEFQPQVAALERPHAGARRNRDAVFTVDEQTALARQYPFAQLRLIDDVGHALHWEQPEVFVRELMRFIK